MKLVNTVLAALGAGAVGFAASKFVTIEKPERWALMWVRFPLMNDPDDDTYTEPGAVVDKLVAGLVEPSTIHRGWVRVCARDGMNFFHVNPDDVVYSIEFPNEGAMIEYMAEQRFSDEALRDLLKDQ